MKLFGLICLAASVAAHAHHNHAHLHKHFQRHEHLQREALNVIEEPRHERIYMDELSKRSSPSAAKLKLNSVSDLLSAFNIDPNSDIGKAAQSAGNSTKRDLKSRQASNATVTPLKMAGVNSTILVIARDQPSASSATSGLNGYGIPFQTLLVPQSGATLPQLNSSALLGNYGGIIVSGQVSYDFGGSLGYQSALTTSQWSQLYNYQILFGVRMVQFDVYPSASDHGASALGGCCNAGVEQLISFSNTSAFTQAGLRSNAGMSTLNLYHFPAQITDHSTTTEIARFSPDGNGQFTANSTAAVINNFSNGRQQMVFFISWGTSFSATSSLLQHAYITWMTRGLYVGFRRVGINGQVDDNFLSTPIYNLNGTRFRLSTQDLTGIKNWIPSINAKMNPGSSYRPEMAYNGNGNIQQSTTNNTNNATCSGGAIYPQGVPADPANIEYIKPLGTGTNAWPVVGSYPYSASCLNLDPMKQWWSQTSNRNAFAHLSHTFTHEHEDYATYSDINYEIGWNKQWLQQTGFSSASMFSSNSLVPPAITGLHNGDALQAWWDNGIRNAVGDNSRPALRNQQNLMWPLYTTVAENGFDGMTILPRWPLRIYYDCDTPACTYAEWANTGGGSGGFANLMAQEQSDTMRYFFNLYRDAYMFHQANLRNADTTPLTTPYGNQVGSLMQNWVETMVHEFTRLVNWPLISYKQSDLATIFNNRYTRDQCNYNMAWLVYNGQISYNMVAAGTNNECSTEIPLTVPGKVWDTYGFRTEQVGSDPLTIWVQLGGTGQIFSFPQAIKV